MKPLVALWLALACVACAAPKPACPAKIVTVDVPQVETRYVVIHEVKPHGALIDTYEDTLSEERGLVTHSKAGTINHLITLDQTARAAFEPLQDDDRRATKPEVAKARAALAALQSYVNGAK